MHERVSASSLNFLGESFDQLLDHWRALDPHRVSMYSGEIAPDQVTHVRDAITAGGWQMESITHVFLPSGTNLSPREEDWVEPRERLSQAIRTSAALGARSIYMLTGGRGTMTWEDAAECFCRAVEPCVGEAKQAGLKLMIENAPFLYVDGHIGSTLRDTITLAEMAGIGVNIELFACWYEAGLDKMIRHIVPRCDLVQVSDYVFGDRSLPARAVPGDGMIPLERIFGWLLDAGYEGAFDLEMMGPRIEKEGRREATRRAADYTSRILEKLGA